MNCLKKSIHTSVIWKSAHKVNSVPCRPTRCPYYRPNAPLILCGSPWENHVSQLAPQNSRFITCTGSYSNQIASSSRPKALCTSYSVSSDSSTQTKWIGQLHKANVFGLVSRTTYCVNVRSFFTDGTKYQQTKEKTNTSSANEDVFKGPSSKDKEGSPSPTETSKGFQENIVTIPNFLTVSRMVLSPYIGYLVLQEDFKIACGLFMFAGITDVLDGWIARRFPSQNSAFGSFIDPLADKLLISILYVTLTMVNLIPVPLALVVISRDVLLVAAGFYVRYISLPGPITLSRFFDGTYATAELKPMLISKLNTTLQLSLVVLTLASPVFGYVDHQALHALWYATAATTVVSGVAYAFAKDTFRVLREAGKKKKLP